ncbi:hypothetical protein D0Y65_048496, partial [Glycine soja]
PKYVKFPPYPFHLTHTLLLSIFLFIEGSTCADPLDWDGGGSNLVRGDEVKSCTRNVDLVCRSHAQI